MYSIYCSIKRKLAKGLWYALLERYGVYGWYIYFLLSSTAFTALRNAGRSFIINPRRACAARVTVVVLCFCVSVCVCVSTTILAPRATRRLMSDTNRFSATRAGKIMWRFC